MTMKDKNGFALKEHTLKRLLVAGTSVLAMGIAAPAMAQQVDEVPDSAQTDADAEDNITVIGSRIRRQGFEDISQPAVVLDTEILDKRGFTNVADALNELPAFGGSVDGLGAQGQNVGQEFLNLFNLGTQRTLTVVNGRRFVPGNVPSSDAGGRLEGSQVDINNFSSPLIERIEILSVGGAPIYGADAVAGVVNIILKDDFEGAQVNYQFSDFVNPSGIVTHNVEAVFGANFADGRGNVTTSFQFEDQQGARLDQFPLADNLVTDFATGGSNPDLLGQEGRFNILEGSFGFLPAPTGGVPLPGLGGTGINVFNDADGNVLTFAGDGRLSIFDPGVQRGSSAFFFEGGSGFDLQDFNELIAPTERFVFSSTAKYDITSNLTAYLETNFLNSSSVDLANQAGTAFNTAFLGAQGQGAFAVSTDSPFIVEEDRQTLIEAGAGDTFFLNGINLGFLPDAGQNFVDTTTFRVVGGLKGGFEFAGRELYYDFSANFGRTEQFRGETFLRGGAVFNAINSVALDAAGIAQLNDADNLGAIADATNNDGTLNVLRNGQVVEITNPEGNGFNAQVGDIICGVFLNAPGALDDDGTLGIVDPSDTPSSNPDVRECTPLNPFIGAGNSSQAIDFISTPALSTGDINQTDFLALIGGDLIDLPAGKAQFSVAFERRRETGSFTPGGVLEDGLSRQPFVPRFDGASIVNNEIAVELSLPILSQDFNLGINDALGFNFIDSVRIDAAYRFINPSFFDDNIHIYTAGANISLLDGDLTIRGNRTTSVRQPSIAELFSPPVQTFNQTGDPCNVTNIQNGNQSRIDNCVLGAQQAGFTGAFFGQGTNPDGTPEVDQNGDPVLGLVLAAGDNVFLTPSVNAAIPLLTGGNPNLIPEENTSYTAGFIYNPSFVPGLSLNADYVVLQINEAIVEQGIAFFTQTCFDEGLDSPECDNFTRTGPSPSSDGSVAGGFDIVSGVIGFGNAPTLRLQAVQAQARYNFDAADAINYFGGFLGQKAIDRDLGSLSLNTTVYAPIVFRNSNAALPVDPDNPVVINQVGNVAFPEIELNASLNYSYDKFDFFWRSIYDDNTQPCFRRSPGSCDQETGIAGQSPGILTLQRDVEHNFSVGYQVNDYISVRGGVNNVLNNRPTLEQQAFGGGGNVLGRSYFLRITARN